MRFKNIGTSQQQASLGHISRKRAKASSVQRKQRATTSTTTTTQKCSVRDIIQAAVRGSQQNKQQQSASSSASAPSSSSAFDTFQEDNDFGNSSNQNDDDQQQYQSPEEILREGNAFFVERNNKERALTRTAQKRIAEMKAINKKGGDSQGFKYIIPKSAKKLANSLAGDLDITEEDVQQSAKRLLPRTANMVLSDDGTNEPDRGGVHRDDRPMRKKKPRNNASRSDFYAWQVHKKWIKNAENFLSRGRVHKKKGGAAGGNFAKRKFRSV